MWTKEDSEIVSATTRAQAAWRRGDPMERRRALRVLSLSIHCGMSLPLFVRWFGDPVRRAPYRARVGTVIETLSYRHPIDPGTTLQFVFEADHLARMRFVVDEGVDRPPRVLDVSEYWQFVDRETEGVRLVLS